MRVKVDNSWVMEVSSVQLGISDDRSRTTVMFTMSGKDGSDPYIEFMFPDNVSSEEAEKKFESLSKDLLEKGFADFSGENLEL